MLAKLENVTKRYRTTEGVRDLTLDFPAGEIVGVLGLNGSGKSTMLKLVAGLLFPTAGTISAAAELVKEYGAKTIHVGATHGIFAGPAVERLSKAPIDEIIVTDTIGLNNRAKKLNNLIGGAFRRRCSGDINNIVSRGRRVVG